MWYDSLEGVQFTKDNGKDVAKWVGGELQDVSVNNRTDNVNVAKSTALITVVTNRGEILLRVGDWITKDKEGRFRIIRINKLDLKRELNRPKPKPKPKPKPNLQVVTHK